MNGVKMYFNRNTIKVYKPLSYFRPWEDYNEIKPNIVEPAPAPKCLDCCPQPVASTVTWWNWFMPVFFLFAIQTTPTVLPGGATVVSTPDVPQTLPTIPPTVKTSPTQESRKKRKRDAEDEDEEDLLKAKRDKNLMKKISKLSREQVEEILPYQHEMARTFAPKERSPAEQLKRDKNTEACRMSRRRKKLMDILKEFSSAFRI
uniref:Flap endonuclease 1 n=1 Tax=Zeugodacus cucurbitae TaxID=28588 RepID=A0A0A1XQ54_ZEUCU